MEEENHKKKYKISKQAKEEVMAYQASSMKSDSAEVDKKRTHEEFTVSPPKKEKRQKHEATTAVEEEYIRRRTRSMSDAEEHFQLKPAQTAAEFRTLHQISVIGKDEAGGVYAVPDPITTFDKAPFSATIKRSLESAGFTHPTPTQAQSWPIALQGRDVITVAKTGSGKTCGFLLPAFHRLLSEPGRKRGAPAILILAPTRELACQIEEESYKFGRSSYIRPVCAYGGAAKSIQIRKLQQGCEVIIATPGRLNDFIEMKVIDLSKILFLVLDEADRM
jgi:ATP-dependent RNA helicase DDX5/DBP2